MLLTKEPLTVIVKKEIFLESTDNPRLEENEEGLEVKAYPAPREFIADVTIKEGATVAIRYAFNGLVEVTLGKFVTELCFEDAEELDDYFEVKNEEGTKMDDIVNRASFLHMLVSVRIKDGSEDKKALSALADLKESLGAFLLSASLFK